MAHAETDSAHVARLFRLASEGSVYYRDFVEPSKDSLAQMGEKSAPWLARRLSTSDARERLTLAEIFEKMGKEGTPFIVPYLDSSGEDMPRNAARCLERIKDTAAVIPLIKQLENPEYSVRSQVALTLGKTGDRRAVEFLTVHLQETDADVRKSCAFALGEIGSPQSARALFDALCDPFFGVRQVAVTALGKLKRPMREVDRRTSGTDEETYSDRPLGQASTDVSALLLEADRPECSCRAEVIVALGAIGGSDPRKRLLGHLRDSNPVLRGFAVEGLSLDDLAKSAGDVEKLKPRESDPFVLAQIARFEAIVAEKKNEQSKPK